MEGTFEDIDLTALFLDQDPQYALKNTTRNFYESDIQKYYAREQGKYYKTVTIASISLQIGSILKGQKNSAYNRF